MSSDAAVGIHNNFPSRQASIAMWSSDNKRPCRINMIGGIVIHQ